MKIHDSTIQIGKTIDRYHILEQLGKGGMATVYKAYDTRLNRDVAIKVLRTEAIPQEQHERLLQRFEREARAMARLTHPNIVPMHDYGEYEGVPYLVMDYLPGGTLKDKSGIPLPSEEALRLLTPIADALAYAHDQGLVHRDVKPSNILITQSGSSMLTDFGIAKMLETEDITLTGTNVGIGTPEYMAPEQWQGKTAPASDQYALGIVLYELLTGVKPYTAETPVAIALKQMNDPLRRPSELAAGIPEWLEHFLFKVLSKQPENRFADMHAMHHSMLRHRLDVSDTRSKPISTPATDPLDSNATLDKLRTNSHISDTTVDEESSKRTERKWSGNTTIDVDPTSRSAQAYQSAVPASATFPKKKYTWLTVLLGVLLLALCGVAAIGAWQWVDSRLKGMPASNPENASPEFTQESPSFQSQDNSQSSEQSFEFVIATATKVSTENSKKTQTNATFTPTVYMTPTPVSYFPLAKCPSSQLHVGDSAFINYEGGKNKLRNTPETHPSDNMIGEILPGEVIEIIDGPKCDFGLLLWEVRTTRNETGWTPETNGEEFWILPLTTRQLCKGALPSRLVVGKQAMVQEEPDSQNIVRIEPNTGASEVGRIKPGAGMLVLEGPECGEGANWWKVESLSSDVIGWTKEGNTKIYYLAPVP